MKNQDPVHVFALWKVKEGETGNVLHLLKTVHDESIKEEGNLFYKIHQSSTDPNTILLFEGYADEDAVAIHRNSPYYQASVLQKISPLLEKREVILATPLDCLQGSK